MRDNLRHGTASLIDYDLTTLPASLSLSRAKNSANFSDFHDQPNESNGTINVICSMEVCSFISRCIVYAIAFCQWIFHVLKLPCWRSTSENVELRLIIIINRYMWWIIKIGYFSSEWISNILLFCLLLSVDNYNGIITIY